MADTYMREAQLLVLKAQEMCLRTLHSGTVPGPVGPYKPWSGGWRRPACSGWEPGSGRV